MKDYYSILGIPRSATSNEIKDAYRTLAKKFHPDINASPDAERIFKELNEAYEVLGDPIKKAQYDQPFLYKPVTTTEPVHRDRAYRSQRYASPKNSEAQRLQQLKEEYKPIFVWLCKIGLSFSILIALDVIIPPAKTQEVIAQSLYSRGSRRSAPVHTFVTGDKTKFKWYGDDNAGFTLDVNDSINLQTSRIFFNVLTVQKPGKAAVVWVTRIYTRLIFFPIILLIASTLGLVFKNNANAVLNLATVSFVTLVICFFLVV